MSPAATAELSASPEARVRILRQARAHFFVHGYSRCTMDDLAADLGMSKKTLYVHFAGKDEIVGAIIQDLADEVRREAQAILQNRGLSFSEKLRCFLEVLLERMSLVEPRILRDLQRFAPHLYAKTEEMRRKNIPFVFGRLVEEGQATGMVRSDVTAAFAIEFLLHAVQGLLRPDTLDQLGLTPRETITRAIDLFFGGLLTPAGRKQYEKCFPR
jgi:AcrR family transcriptional regulator